MLKAYKEYWKGYVDFRGQTSVGGYWWAVLANNIVTFVASLFSSLINANRPESGVAFSFAFMLLCLLPSLAIMVRRLRDAGYKWTNIFWVFLPIAGFIILIVRLCKPSRGDSYKPVTQQVSASGAPVYQTYSQLPTRPVPTAAVPAAKPVLAAKASILDHYKAGLSYLDGCAAFDETKFREFNRITGNRFSEEETQNQLSNAKLMLGGMGALRNTLRSTTLEAIHTFESLERSGIDLSAYNL